MTTSVQNPRPKIGRTARPVGGSRSTVREVRLVGGHPVTADWHPGRQVEWDGRPYRVASLQGAPETATRDSTPISPPRSSKGRSGTVPRWELGTGSGRLRPVPVPSSQRPPSVGGLEIRLRSESIGCGRGKERATCPGRSAAPRKGPDNGSPRALDGPIVGSRRDPPDPNGPPRPGRPGLEVGRAGPARPDDPRRLPRRSGGSRGTARAVSRNDLALPPGPGRRPALLGSAAGRLWHPRSGGRAGRAAAGDPESARGSGRLAEPAATLILIGGKTYGVERVPGTPLAPLQYRLTRLPPLDDGPYYACQLRDGSTQCDCAEWTYQVAQVPDAPPCKHLAALAAMGWL